MPRRRTISCPHCGFMQLKRDETCDGCGAETEQSKRRANAMLFQFGFTALVALGFYLYVRHIIPGGG